MNKAQAEAAAARVMQDGMSNAIVEEQAGGGFEVLVKDQRENSAERTWEPAGKEK